MSEFTQDISPSLQVRQGWKQLCGTSPRQYVPGLLVSLVTSPGASVGPLDLEAPMTSSMVIKDGQ